MKKMKSLKQLSHATLFKRKYAEINATKTLAQHPAKIVSSTKA